MMQYITRKFSFDSAHRVMNERMKCYKLHGHLYFGELTFSFTDMQDLGFPIDFKEIKRIGCQWIDDLLDHNAIFNPCDHRLIEACKVEGTDPYLMSLNGAGEYCNPTVENIVREVFLAQEVLFEGFPNLSVHRVRIYETPNCYSDCFKESIPAVQRKNFLQARYAMIREYAQNKGVVEYDSRKAIYDPER